MSTDPGDQGNVPDPDPVGPGAVGEEAVPGEGAPELVGLGWVLWLAPLLSLVVPFTVLLGAFGDSDDGLTAFLFLVGLVLSMGSVYGFGAWMWRRGSVRPWELPLVVCVAVVGVLWVGYLRLEWVVAERFSLVGVVLGSLVSALAGAAVVWSLRPGRARSVLAVGVVMALCSVVLGVSWGQKRVEDVRQNQELSGEVAALGHPVAVLEAPGWKPVSVYVRDDDEVPVEIAYVPARGVVGEKGFQLNVQTLVEDAGESGVPARMGCADGEGDSCERHGSVTVYDGSDRPVPRMSAWVEVEEGLVAYLVANVPTEKDGTPRMEMPDLDMVGLAEQVRAVEGEDAQVLVRDVL